jgi:hypothetical protein
VGTEKASIDFWDGDFRPAWCDGQGQQVAALHNDTRKPARQKIAPRFEILIFSPDGSPVV